jgi:catechol 2,3-dioxygenase-like lactoylglutathione lyase family enzyme
MSGFHHVKVPVSDIGRSLEWYRRVLGLEVSTEFVEEGVLMGVALSDPGATLQLALRARPDLAKHMAGFDPIAFAVPTRADLERWRARLDELGEPHGGIASGHVGWVIAGLLDPDGIELRLYTVEGHSREGQEPT